MPRPNKGRQVGFETALAGRIRQERDREGWSYEGLAGRMTEAGCSMQASAIHKIENPRVEDGETKRRRITLDEAVTFANVFGMRLESLLVPVDVASSREALSLWTKYDKTTERYLEIRQELETIEERLLELVDSDVGEHVLNALRSKHGDEVGSTLHAAAALKEGRKRVEESRQARTEEGTDRG